MMQITFEKASECELKLKDLERGYHVAWLATFAGISAEELALFVFKKQEEAKIKEGGQ